MSKVYVTAKITAKPGQADNLQKELLAVVPTVRQENGCLRYDLHRQSREGNVFLFYEIWESGEALKTHGQSAHMAAMHDGIQDLLDGPSQISLWQEVDRAE